MSTQDGKAPGLAPLLPAGEPVEQLLRKAQFFVPGGTRWETQQTDHPSTGPDSPEYEPRGSTRGSSFSWYTYSPPRVRYPYIRANCSSPGVRRNSGSATRFGWTSRSTRPQERRLLKWDSPVFHYGTFVPRVRATTSPVDYGQPAEPGTSGRRWRKIGVPY